MFRCYTLTKSGIADGITPSLFDSAILPDSVDKVDGVDVRAVPVMDDTDGLSLPFISEASGKMQPGAVMALRPSEWTMCTDESNIMLIDPGGDDGHVLLFIPANSAGALMSTELTGQARVLSTDKDGKPVVTPMSRGQLNAYALNLTEMSPESEPQSKPSPGKGARASRRSARRGASH